MCRLDELDDEDKLRQSIEYVAVGQPLPDSLSTFLKEQGLYDAILNPKVKDNGDKLHKSKRSRRK